MTSILIIDDDEQIRGLFRAILEEAGFVVREAATGSSAVRLFREAPTVAVITVMYMPDGDGLTVIRDLRTEYPNLRIIAISGTDATDDKLQEARELRTDAILLKPVAVEELLGGVHHIFERAHSHPAAEP